MSGAHLVGMPFDCFAWINNNIIMKWLILENANCFRVNKVIYRQDIVLYPKQNTCNYILLSFYIYMCVWVWVRVCMCSIDGLLPRRLRSCLLLILHAITVTFFSGTQLLVISVLCAICVASMYMCMCVGTHFQWTQNVYLKCVWSIARFCRSYNSMWHTSVSIISNLNIYLFSCYLEHIHTYLHIAYTSYANWMILKIQ